ncbi:ATP-binding protein [Sphingomonas sp. TF3]|uniref:DNA-packaging protein n=1 Tax=Sphingomonas sp. TF3 TaxID=2495580 RepID=UPI000F880BF6|nr:terminase family protein [Sphingomonas sp. TF3]RUN77533.1 ATP-binding protein [Sphingomonas sp. TF3]
MSERYSGEQARALVLELARLPAGVRETVLRDLTAAQRAELNWSWERWTQEGQEPPAGPWRVWLIRAGRGFGKTRAGAEWVSEIARATPGTRIALVGATIEDVRRVMIEGESGLIAVARPGESVDYRSRGTEVEFASKARATIFSASAPEKLRGPEHAAAWCDELAKWRNGDATWDNLMLGMRMGDAPQVVVTTTPRPTPLLRRIMALEGLAQSGGSSHKNVFLPESFLAAIERAYGGTRLGRQEIAGELLADVEGALWTHAQFDAARVVSAPALVRTVVAVDPPAGTESGRGGDACGIVAAGLGRDGRGYVLEDASVTGLSPEGWAQAVAGCAARHRADRVIAEKNQGGRMVQSVLLAADASLPLKLVHASDGKVARAEPVALLYERGDVSHVGAMPDLERELCGLVVGGGYQGPSRSPDRADALVWALGELLLKRRGGGRVRGL